MKPHNLILSLILIFVVLLMTQYINATTAADFLNIGVSARQYSLAGAGLALDNGIASAYSNPAGLAYIERSGVSFMHNLWYQDIAYDYLGAAMPLGEKGTIALSTTYLHMGKIAAYDEYDQPIGGLSPYSMAGIISYGRRVSDRLTLGISGKFITEKLADLRASGMAVDIGGQIGIGNFEIGAAVTNLGPSMKYAEQSFKLPSSALLSIGYSIPMLPTNLVAGVKAPFTGNAVGSAGIEYRATDFLYLRSGYSASSAAPSEKGFDLGMGVAFLGGTLDYSYSPGKYFDGTHAFSFTFSFGKQRRQYETNTVTTKFTQSKPLPTEPAEVNTSEETPYQALTPQKSIEGEKVEPTVAENLIRNEELAAPPRSPRIQDQPTPNTAPLYVVSAGRFREAAGARIQMDMLARFDFDAFTEVLPDGLIRVWLLKTADKKKAEKLLAKAVSKGLNCRMEIDNQTN